MYLCKHDSKVKIYKSINDHNHTEKIKHGIPQAKWGKCPELAAFLDFFNAEYVYKSNNWFEGASAGYPSTNSALEATNNVIKNEGTLRQKLPLHQFLQAATSILCNWSVERNPEHNHAKLFAAVPTIDTQLASLGYHLSNERVNSINLCRHRAQAALLTPRLTSTFKTASSLTLVHLTVLSKTN